MGTSEESFEQSLTSTKSMRQSENAKCSRSDECMLFYSHLDSIEELNEVLQPLKPPREIIHSRIPVWKTSDYILPSFSPSETCETENLSVDLEANEDKTIEEESFELLDGSNILDDLKTMEFPFFPKKEDCLLQKAMLHLGVKYNMSLKSHCSVKQVVFFCGTRKNLKDMSLDCPFLVSFMLKRNRWKIDLDECILSHKKECRSSMFDNDFLNEIVKCFPDVTKKVVYESERPANVTRKLISRIQQRFFYQSTLCLNIEENEAKVNQKVLSAQKKISKNLKNQFEVEDQEFLNIVNHSMKQGFSIIYTCIKDEYGQLDHSAIKDVFIVYSPSVQLFMKGVFSTVGIHTARDKKLLKRQSICHIVALDDSGRPFPLVTGYLSDEKEETYVSLLRSFFYSLYCRNFRLRNLEDIWNVTFENYLSNEAQYMPIKVLLVEPIKDLSNALDHFPFISSDVRFNLNTVLKMHLRKELTETEAIELKFMNFEDDENISTKNQSKYILVKFCSWTTSLSHIQTFFKYFDFGVNVDNDYNLNVLQNMKGAKIPPRNKLNSTSNVYTDLDNFGIVGSDIKTLDSDTMNLVAIYYRVLRSNPNMVEHDLINHTVEEVQKFQKNLNMNEKLKESTMSELSNKPQVITSNENDEEVFDSNGVLKVDENPLWSTEKNWIFTTEFAELFQYDEEIKKIFLKVFGPSPKISFGSFFSKISKMMNTSSLEEGLDLFLSILWCLTRLKDGERIFELLKQDVFHVTNRYRFSYFLGNLLKLSVINCNNGSKIEDKICLSYCESRFFIHTYHNGAYNALFAKNMSSGLQGNRSIKKLSAAVSNINTNARNRIEKTLNERSTYKEQIPNSAIPQKCDFFECLKNITRPNSSKLLKTALDNLKRRFCLLYKRVIEMCHEIVPPELCQGMDPFKVIGTSDAFIISINKQLISQAERECNKICYLAFGIPCEHVLIRDYVSIKFVENDDEKYQIEFKHKSIVRPDKYFLDNQFEKLFDEEQADSKSSTTNSKDELTTEIPTDNSTAKKSQTLLTINDFLDTIHPKTKEHVRNNAVKKQLASLPYAKSVQDSDRLSLEAFISLIYYLLSQNDDAVAKKSNKRLYSQMISNEKQETNSTQPNTTDKESGETDVNKETEPNGSGKQIKHVANKLEEGTTNRDKVESPSNSTSNNDIDPNSSTDSTNNITIHGNIHGTVNNGNVNNGTINGTVNNHHEHDYIITYYSPSSPVPNTSKTVDTIADPHCSNNNNTTPDTRLAKMNKSNITTTENASLENSEPSIPNEITNTEVIIIEDDEYDDDELSFISTSKLQNSQTAIKQENDVENIDELLKTSGS